MVRNFVARQNTLYSNDLVRLVFMSSTYIRFKLSLHNLACLWTNHGNGTVSMVLNNFSSKLTRFFFDKLRDRASSHRWNRAQVLCFLNMSVLGMPNDRLSTDYAGLLILAWSSHAQLFLKPLRPIKLLDPILWGARLIRRLVKDSAEITWCLHSLFCLVVFHSFVRRFFKLNCLLLRNARIKF